MFILMTTIVSTIFAGPIVYSALTVAMDAELAGASQEAVDEALLASISGLGGLGLGLYGLFALAVFIPSIAVTVRRLHDRDMSGWWYLGFGVASLVPFVGFLASLAFLVVLFMPGTPGSNRFGPDPKNPYQEDVFA